MDYRKDLEKLAKRSVMASKFVTSDFETLDPMDDKKINPMDFSFHPSGNCGCIELGDDYMFGIRCNHLIWMEGWTEGTERFWTQEDIIAAGAAKDFENSFNTILVCGNHKGLFMQKLIVFHETSVENYLVTIKKIHLEATE